MNNTILEMKLMRRAMQPFVLMIYELVFETKPKNVLEIGVRQGQSTRAILSALNERKGGILTSIDLGAICDRVPEEFKNQWVPVSGDSHIQETYDKVNDKKYEIILIDGDHNYEGVKKDFEMYSPLLADNGIILMHDIINNDCGVPKFWAEIKFRSDAPWQQIGLNYGVAGMGLIQKPPITDGKIDYEKV